MAKLVECIPNFSCSKEKDEAAYNALVQVAESVPGCTLFDAQTDGNHNRCVFTLIGNIDAIVEHIQQRLASHQPQPSLLHGDLWSGNCALGPDGPYIFDPACYWGDRECDLAMLPLHTEQPPQIYDGYQSVSPLPADFLERQPVYQLYTLLNRARLFGGQHLVIAQQSLDRLLAA